LKVRDIPGTGAGFYGDFKIFRIPFCDKVVTFVFRAPRDILDGPGFQVASGNTDGFVFARAGHGSSVACADSRKLEGEVKKRGHAGTASRVWTSVAHLPYSKGLLEVGYGKNGACLLGAFRACLVPQRDVDVLGRELSGKSRESSGHVRKLDVEHVRLSVRKARTLESLLGFLHVVHDDVYGSFRISRGGEKSEDVHLRFP